jgi:hypothetical protein
VQRETNCRRLYSPSAQARPARWLAVVCGAIELVATYQVERGPGLVGEPYRTGLAGCRALLLDLKATGDLKLASCSLVEGCPAETYEMGGSGYRGDCQPVAGRQGTSDLPVNLDGDLSTGWKQLERDFLVGREHQRMVERRVGGRCHDDDGLDGG